MTRPYLLLACLLCFLTLHEQETTHDLAYYLEEAKANSPFLRDYHNQREIGQMELYRLKAFYEHSRMEVTGDYLFVPIIDKEGGKASFRPNAQDATDYYGYDLGESSGHLHAGVTWTQPLLGCSSYKMIKEQTDIQDAILRHDICLEGHGLERSVTEQYLLCLLDRAQIAFTDSVDSLLGMRAKAVGRLVKAGQTKRSDLRLLSIEREANREIRLSALQSYHMHLMDLNLLCGIDDTSTVELRDADIRYTLPDRNGESIFTYQYQLDSLAEKASLRSFDLQYRPQLDLFVDGGLQVATLPNGKGTSDGVRGIPSHGPFSMGSNVAGGSSKAASGSRPSVPTGKTQSGSVG